MKTNRQLPQYSPTLAANLDDLAKALNIPRKIINRWRKEWLSYPVPPAQFDTLIVISAYVWGINTVMKVQLARMSSGDRLRLANDAGLSKPQAYCRNIILKRMLAGECSLPTKTLIGRVRCFYPNGYVSVTPRAVRNARAWARRQYNKARLDSQFHQLLIQSLDNIHE